MGRFEGVPVSPQHFTQRIDDAFSSQPGIKVSNSTGGAGLEDESEGFVYGDENFSEFGGLCNRQHAPDMGTPSYNALPHPHHLDSPGNVDAEFAGTIFARDGSDSGVQVQGSERLNEPAHEPLEAWLNMEMGVTIRARPSESEGRLEKGGRMATGESNVRFVSEAPRNFDRVGIARTTHVQTRKEECLVGPIESETLR